MLTSYGALSTALVALCAAAAGGGLATASDAPTTAAPQQANAAIAAAPAAATTSISSCWPWMLPSTAGTVACPSVAAGLPAGLPLPAGIGAPLGSVPPPAVLPPGYGSKPLAEGTTCGQFTLAANIPFSPPCPYGPYSQQASLARPAPSTVAQGNLPPVYLTTTVTLVLDPPYTPGPPVQPHAMPTTLVTVMRIDGDVM